MAESFDPEAFDQAYREVELSYSEGRFQEALQQADALLEQQALGESDPRTERLKLILGHIHLHGLQQPERAIDHYRDVLDTGSTPTYLDLAQQGMALCQEAFAQAATMEQGMAAVPIVTPAMPWLLDSASGSTELDLDLSIEPVRIEELGFGAGATKPAPVPARSPLAVDPLAEADLAKGLLRVVLS